MDRRKDLTEQEASLDIDPRWRSIHLDGSDYPGEDHPAMRALRTGEQIHNDTMGVFNPQKESYVWLNINARPQFMPGEEKPYQVYTTFEDVTEIKEKDAELTEVLANLKRSNRDLEQFAYVASHDLQEPLNTIINFANVIQAQTEGILDNTAKMALTFVFEATNRMKLLIEALLNYSRVRRTTVTQDKISFLNLINNVMIGLQDAILRTNAVIEYPAEDQEIYGHEALLHQLLQNLIANALKFQKPDQVPCVQVTVMERPSQWEFAVADNGIGIKEDNFEEIFAIFRRLHSTDIYKGTGLGLAVCKQIVELHGGKIWLTSQPNIGTTFYFTLLKKVAA